MSATNSPDAAAPSRVRAQPQRILIVRLTALGDVIHGLPVACALRREFPDAQLGWVVEGGSGELLQGHPAIDHLIRVRRRWLKSPAAVRQLRRQLRALRFDVAIDLQGLTKSALVARLSGAPRRLGAGGSDGRELSKWLNNELTLIHAAHVIEHYLGILAPLGVRRPEVQFHLPETPSDARYATDALASLGLQAGQFAVLNPGAGWPSKLWPAERYGAVAQHLLRRRDLPTLAVWAGPERSLAEQIVAASGGACRLAPPTRLGQLAAVLRRSALFVGSDTGPMHLSVAVGTPTISLHGPSRAAWCGAYGPHSERLQAWYQAGSARERRAASNEAMRDITSQTVFAACDRLLGRRSLEQRAG